MRINRSLLNWGVFLIALGGVPLAVQQGWADSSIAGDLWRIWPLVLVGVGLGLILRWTPFAWLGGALVAATFGLVFGALVAGGVSGISSACVGLGSGETATTDESGEATAPEFRLDLSLSCGELAVSRGSGGQWSVSARHAPDAAPTIEGSAAGLAVNGGSPARDFFVLGQQTRNDWRVELPAPASLSVIASLNAADGSIDLGAGPLARVEGQFDGSDIVIDLSAATTPMPAALEMTFNASAGRLALPTGSVVGNVTLNVSAFTLCIPASAEARLELATTLSSDDLAESGLTKVGDGWQSAGYDTAATRIDLSLTSTVSSLSIERPEACS
jgi:hypothetical protein